MKLLERFQGSMLGLAIGDALGFPVEFMNRSEIVRNYGPDGVTDFLPNRRHGEDRIGRCSDDTQMSIAVARALIAADLDSLDDVMAHVRGEFVAWANSEENDRAPGQTCMDGVRRMERGAHWFSSDDAYSKGCGAAMRVAPIGLVFHRSPERLREVSRAVSICTHAHPTGISSSLAAAAAVAHVVNGRPVGGLLEALRGFLREARGAPGCEEIVDHDPLGDQLRAFDTVTQALDGEPGTACSSACPGG